MDNKHLNFLYFLPILILLLGINLFVDPASIITFSFPEESWAREIMNNNIVLIEGKKDFDFYDRKFKQKLIELIPKEIDEIILGPSLVMEIRKSDVGVDKFYNLGIKSEDIYDLLAQIGLLEINGVKTKKIIICIASDLFDEKVYNRHKDNRPLRSYSNYMLNILNNKQTFKPNNKNEFIPLLEQCIDGMFSLTYFQSSLKYLLSNKEVHAGFKIKEYSDANMQNIYGPGYIIDGSYIYSKDAQTRQLKEIQQKMKRYNENAKNNHHTINSHMSDFSKQTFEKIVKYYLDRGVKVELFLCPYPPTSWDILMAQNYPIINEEEEFAKELANKYNIRVIGSLNPYNVGVSDEDYYDQAHMRHDSLVKYFDFKK